MLPCGLDAVVWTKAEVQQEEGLFIREGAERAPELVPSRLSQELPLGRV